MLNYIYRVFLLGMLMFLTACGDNHSDLEQYVDQVKRTASSNVEPIPVISLFMGEEYTAQGLRNPFVSGSQSGGYPKPAVRNKTATNLPQQPRPDASRPRDYLERFPLSSLTMVGTLSKPNMRWGLVRDGQGMIHAVTVGDYLGEDSGEIIAITPNQIRINETVPNNLGGWMQTRVALNLFAAAANTNGQESSQKASMQKTSDSGAQAPKLQQKAQQLKAAVQNLQQKAQSGNNGK